MKHTRTTQKFNRNPIFNIENWRCGMIGVEIRKGGRMLATILLVIGCVALVLMIVSMIGIDFGSFDLSVGDSGAGLLSLLAPFVAGFGILGGGLMSFTGLSPVWSLLIGAGAGILLATASFATLGYLVGAEEELPSLDLVGYQVRVVDPVGPDHLGSGEVKTPIGARNLSLTSQTPFVHNDLVRIVAKIEDRNLYLVEKLPFDDGSLN